MMQTMTGGDGIANIILDTEDGFGSSVPGRPRNMPTVPKAEGKGECGVSLRLKQGSGRGTKRRKKDTKASTMYSSSVLESARADMNSKRDRL